MSREVTDTAGAPVSLISLSLAASSSSAVVELLVPCVAGMYLAASSEAGARVLARRTGSGEAFADLSTSPVLLTPWAGQSVAFDFQVAAGAVEGRAFMALPVRVTFNP